MQAGEFFSSATDLEQLVVGMHDAHPVFLQDVAQIVAGAAENTVYVWHADKASGSRSPAVTVAIGKKPGQNAVDVTRQVLQRVDH